MEFQRLAESSCKVQVNNPVRSDRASDRRPTVCAKSEAQREGVAGSQIVRKICNGALAAEAEMVERYGPGLRLLLARLGASATLGEDVYQSTFAVALHKIRQGQLREPAALVGYLRSTARNLLFEARRKADRFASIEDETQPMAHLRGSLIAEAGQLNKLLADENTQIMRSLLEQLSSERDREVLTRYYLLEQSGQEICDFLDVSPRLFNRVLYRARQRLRKSWQRAVLRNRLRASSGRSSKALTVACVS